MARDGEKIDVGATLSLIGIIVVGSWLAAQTVIWAVNAEKRIRFLETEVRELQNGKRPAIFTEPAHDDAR